jgi:hypothetical protein
MLCASILKEQPHQADFAQIVQDTLLYPNFFFPKERRKEIFNASTGKLQFQPSKVCSKGRRTLINLQHLFSFLGLASWHLETKNTVIPVLLCKLIVRSSK